MTMKNMKLFKNTSKTFTNSNQKSQAKSIILAYKPIWAIGQSEVIIPKHAHNTHDIIRETLSNLYEVTLKYSVYL